LPRHVILTNPLFSNKEKILDEKEEGKKKRERKIPPPPSRTNLIKSFTRSGLGFLCFITHFLFPKKKEKRESVNPFYKNTKIFLFSFFKSLLRIKERRWKRKIERSSPSSRMNLIKIPSQVGSAVGRVNLMLPWNKEENNIFLFVVFCNSFFLFFGKQKMGDKSLNKTQKFFPFFFISFFLFSNSFSTIKEKQVDEKGNTRGKERKLRVWRMDWRKYRINSFFSCPLRPCFIASLSPQELSLFFLFFSFFFLSFKKKKGGPFQLFIQTALFNLESREVVNLHAFCYLPFLKKGRKAGKKN